MGSRFSDLKPSNDWKYLNPTPSDVHLVRQMFLQHLPIELIEEILAFADYWPRISYTRHLSFDGRPTSNIVNWCYLATPPVFMDYEGYGRITKVTFSTESRDQGWGGETADRGTYHGSYTWFEAGIFRPSTQGTVQWLDVVDDEPIDLMNLPDADSLENLQTYEELSNPSYEGQSTRWHVQRNVCASREYRNHVVSWDARDPEHAGEDEDDMTGAGRGKGSFRVLQSGDRIAVFSRALYPGWRNNVNAVSVEINYTA